MKKLAIASAVASLMLMAGLARAADPLSQPTFTYNSYPAAAAPVAGDGPNFTHEAVKGWPAANVPIDDATENGANPLRIEIGLLGEHEGVSGPSGHSDAFLPGVEFGLGHTFDNGSDIALDAKYLGSKDGSYSSAKGSVAGGLDNSLVDARLQYHYATGWHDVGVLAGLGYRIQDGTSPLGGGTDYERTNKFFATVGVDQLFHVSDSFSVAPRLAYDQVIIGHQYDNVYGETSSKGYGAELSVPITYHAGSRDLTLTPYAQEWKANSITDKEIGVSLAVKF
jgi:hypothetical protein